MAGKMQAFRAVLSFGRRQGSPQVITGRTTYCMPLSTSSVHSRSADEWLENIKLLAKKDVPIKRTKLASYLKVVTTREELETSKEIMKIYEQKRVDPDANAAGLFIKKALELNAPDVAMDVLNANYRIGLFLEPSTLNRLMSAFLMNKEFDKVFMLHEIGDSKYQVKSTNKTYNILIRAAIEQDDFEKALDLFKTAAYV